MPASQSLPDEAERAARRKLPAGVRTFREMREDDCYYVDKTEYMIRLASEGRHYVLSRPRHFGKSLFVDTLKELFEGNESLFEGLEIHDHWNWSVRYPVVRLDFGSGKFSEPGILEANLMAQLAAVEQGMGLRIEHQVVSGRFAMLLKALHERSGQRVIVLIDEYDKPILDAMNEPEIARANLQRPARFLCGARVERRAHRVHVPHRSQQVLQGQPVLRTSTTSRTSPWTPVSPPSAALPTRSWTRSSRRSFRGSTGTPFATGTTATAGWGTRRCTAPMTSWRCSGNRKFSAWWLETGTPEFLVQALCRRRISSVDMAAMPCSHELLSAFDVDHIGTEALLFQGGYLTVTAREELGGATLYRLGYPNRAVRQRLNEQMLRYLVKNTTRQMANHVRLYRTLAANDFPRLKKLFRRFFTSIPREWYVHHDMAGYEGFCASVFYSYFAALGFQVTVEGNTSRGRVDMAVLFHGNVYLFEFKVVEIAGEAAASARLRGGGVADKYRHLNQPIHLVAVEFSKERRKVVSFEVWQAAP